MAKTFLFERMALIGIGLIGSSLARAARKHGLVKEIVVTARTEKTLATVRKLKLADRTITDAADCVKGADIVVLCSPLGTYADIAAKIGPALKRGAIVTDVGSAKQCVIRDVGPALPDGVHLVPGHPVAGTEHSGPEAGFAELFKGRWCILTPTAEVPEGAVKRVEALWQGAGSKVTRMGYCSYRNLHGQGKPWSVQVYPSFSFKRAAEGRYLENGRISEKLRRKGLKPETRFRPDKQ